MKTIAAMGLPGGTELILIIFVIILLFGARKLPELARSLGKSLNEFKKGQREESLDVSKSSNFNDNEDDNVDEESGHS
tara:strand:- start:1282 stop:1515 length:234 start_codon:yes stop_codon:yes gene_type:complete